MLSFSASAQNIERVRRGLAENSNSGGSVVILQGEGVAEAVATVEAKRTRKTLNGYRIVIFSDNGQYAGDRARAVLGAFKSNFPGISAYLVYESPYFKVLVGNCITKEDAQILLSKVRRSYPSAFPRNETIPLTALTAPLKRGRSATGIAEEKVECKECAEIGVCDEHLEKYEVFSEEDENVENETKIEAVDSLATPAVVAE